eukprot:Gregarina_sp_Pseudo_9__3146@NODE_3338_length_676_cov_8_532182_g3046_i0_p1_GENE_NODE_3338_length_676_cov_8_532182_g3046_i0NODE_3338_length_676_cov_8_532182_g3046_i0_p1_ORF_typecomplete_len137_score1_48TMEM154/PF15102_6/0_14EPV_E5/PF08135_11/0_16_NODE_3338_length_676_cov_8_532182_g3046_i0176586
MPEVNWCLTSQMSLVALFLLIIVFLAVFWAQNQPNHRRRKRVSQSPVYIESKNENNDIGTFIRHSRTFRSHSIIVAFVQVKQAIDARSVTKLEINHVRRSTQGPSTVVRLKRGFEQRRMNTLFSRPTITAPSYPNT